MAEMNQFEQPVGNEMTGWAVRPRPQPIEMIGRYCWLSPLDPLRDGAVLHEAYRPTPQNWTYLAYGPFDSAESYTHWLQLHAQSDDPLFYTIFDHQTKQAVGVASYLRIDPPNGVIEVGHIHYAPSIQKTVIATEAIYLMMSHAFDELGYRRCEWKCDALNAPSRRAAVRFGFTFEGLFRQAMIYKGRNRDTAWYALLDGEWSSQKARFEAWLDPINFDDTGKQHSSLVNVLQGKKKNE